MKGEWIVMWLLGCGVVLNFWMLWKAGKLLGAVIAAAVIAGSITRFTWACGKAHGFREARFPPWVYAPSIWFDFFLIELGASNGSVTHFGGRGVWKGIGDWTVYPAIKEGEQ